MKLTANPAWLSLSPHGGNGSGAKFLRIMKLTTIIILAACLHTSAKGVAQQTITFSGKEVNLESVFSAIKKQTNYRFFFNTDMLTNASKITIDVKNAQIEQVMNMALKDQPLTFTIKGRTIFIMKKLEEIKKSVQLAPTGDPISVSGRVTDENGEPLAGANVKVKGSSNGVTTDAQGRFALNGVDPNASLEVSFVGRETEILSVKGKTVFSVALGQRQSLLDETLVIAYGTTTKRLNTGNVSSVKASDIQNQPINNPLLALQGRVPGLFITQSTGLPGSGVTVRVQGQISLNSGSDPLYVIDGVPYLSQMLPTISSVLGSSGGGSTNGTGNPLSFLNPADIESIDVLKDADATSIYGSRAAGGAILITTKKGKAGRTKVDVNVNSGWGKVTRKWNLMNTDQYLSMRRQAFINDGRPIPNFSTIPTFNNYDLTIWDSTRYTDWQDVLVGNTAHYTDGQVSVSGGNANTHFRVGAGYHRETTVFPGNLSDIKKSVHFNLNNVSLNQKFRLEISGMYLIDNNKLQSTDLASTASTLPPNAPATFNPDGTLNWAPTSSGTSTWTNPLSYIYNKYNIQTNNLIGNAIVSYQLLPGLDVKTNLGYTHLQSDEQLLFPLLGYAPDSRPFETRSSFFGNSTVSSYIIEPQATYSFNLAKSKFEALIGTIFQQNNSTNQQIEASGFNSDAVMADIKSAPTVSISSTLSSIYNYNAVFGRLNYKWLDKYIINITGRRDGSSRFGSSNLFHNFWSTAGAWIFSEENFIKENFSFISYGKLRASYGTSGNDQIGDYRFMTLYDPVTASAAYQGATGLLPDRVPNSHVQWEETKKLGFGAELGLFNNRILATVNYYRNRSSNQLQSYPLPSITGFGSIQFFNLPATIENTGWEFILQTTNLRKKDFRWNSNINLTIPRNKLVSFPEFENSSYSSLLVIGQPFTITKAYPYLGVDPTTGIYQFTDANGNPIFRPNFATDATVLYNNTPKFYGGFQNTITYKSLQLDFLFQFVKQVGKNLSVLGSSIPGVMVNQPEALADSWTKAGDNVAVQRYTTGRNSNALNGASNFSNSTAAWTDASYVRLKNLSLSWTMPKSWITKIKMQNARLYVQGQNLLTITNYFGDPETKSISSLPPLSILTVGVHVTL